MKIMNFAATGDSFVTRRYPKQDMEFQKVKDIIRSAQARFTNLEVTIRDNEGFPAAQSGGTWATTDPETLKSIKNFGFNLIGTANNHALDYSYGGLEATLKNLDRYGFVHTGAGVNLAQAGKPVYLDCPSGRVALIAATSSLYDSWIAGEQRKDMIGRPGVNPLRITTEYHCKPDEFEALKKIAFLTGINAYDDMIRKEGFLPKLKEDEFLFGQYSFKKSNFSGVITRPHEKDMDRLMRTVDQATWQSDYVLVSIHSHQIKGTDKNYPTDFLVTAAKKCIDAGAHAVIGHGPHVLRGIEIYKEKPIFYSLGNFIFQSETVSALPEDFYEKYGLNHDHHVSDALRKRSNNGTVGLMCDPHAMESIIATWDMIDGKLTELRLTPINLGYNMQPWQNGWPCVTEREDILERLNELSKPFDVSIRIQNGTGIIHI